MAERSLVYRAREKLLLAANRALLADRLDHSGPHDAAEQEYADDMLIIAARQYAEVTATADIPECR